MAKIVLTGDRPTGPLHLGHYVGSLKTRIDLQTDHTQYIMVADVQALTDYFLDPNLIRIQCAEVVKDYIACGIDPEKSTIFIQSGIPELAELTVYYLNLVTLGRLERNPTVKSEIHQKGYDDSIPAGFFCYPVSQAADITAFQAELVPVGSDQIPMIEQTNEIVRKFNRIYKTQCLKEAEALCTNTPRLVGLDGRSKASKSLGNAIFLSDPLEIVKQKVFSMFTDPSHLKISDKGQVEGNVVFSYLDAFHPCKDEVSALKSHYKRGGLGDTTIKKILNDTLTVFLKPIQERRLAIRLNDITEILEEGTIQARVCAQNTLSQVRSAMGIWGT